MITIYSLWSSGALDLHIKLGIVRSAVIEYCQIYKVYCEFRSKGYNYTQAIEATSEKLFLTEAKVKVAIAEVM